jgi:biopolymer transport protein ExbB
VRLLTLILRGSGSGKLLARVEPFVQAGRIEEASRLCARVRGAAGRVLGAALRNLHLERQKLEDVVSESMLREAPAIERFGSTTLVLAAISPLLGLLGTVTGIIQTFDVITEFGTGDPKLLSHGISVALVTTELGLIVAIPVLLFGTLLSGRARASLQSIETAALAVVNMAKTNGLDRSVEPPVHEPEPEPEPEPVETRAEVISDDVQEEPEPRTGAPRGVA